jgi:hypothetical protein
MRSGAYTPLVCLWHCLPATFLLPVTCVLSTCDLLCDLQMEQSFSMQINMGLAQDGESDEVGGSQQNWDACMPACLSAVGPCVSLAAVLHVCGCEHIVVEFLRQWTLVTGIQIQCVHSDTHANSPSPSRQLCRW